MGKNLCKVENKWNYMTQEDKELLLKDLCARLPYGLKYNYGGYDGCDYTMNRVDCNAVDCAFPIEDVKPYLFPLSNITEEEFTKLKEYSGLKYNQLDLASFQNDTYKCLDFYLCEVPSYVVIRVFDWLNKNHFDYRGLIEKELAIDATGLNVY